MEQVIEILENIQEIISIGFPCLIIAIAAIGALILAYLSDIKDKLK